MAIIFTSTKNKDGSKTVHVNEEAIKLDLWCVASCKDFWFRLSDIAIWFISDDDAVFFNLTWGGVYGRSNHDN